MTPLLVGLSVLLAAGLPLVAVGIGLFYRLKFGESTRWWMLIAGSLLALAGAGLTAFRLPLAADLVFLAGAVFLGLGTFWLWYVMLGPRR